MADHSHNGFISNGPACAGRPWSVWDDRDLVLAVKRGGSIKEAAEELRRDPAECQARLRLLATEKVVPLLPDCPANMGARWFGVDDASLLKIIEQGLPIASAATYLKRTPEECRARLKELRAIERLAPLFGW